MKTLIERLERLEESKASVHSVASDRYAEYFARKAGESAVRNALRKALMKMDWEDEEFERAQVEEVKHDRIEITLDGKSYKFDLSLEARLTPRR